MQHQSNHSVKTVKMSVVVSEDLFPCAEPAPQAACRRSDGAWQKEAPKGLAQTPERPPLTDLPQMLLGYVVNSPELSVIVVP